MTTKRGSDDAPPEQPPFDPGGRPPAEGRPNGETARKNGEAAQQAEVRPVTENEQEKGRKGDALDASDLQRDFPLSRVVPEGLDKRGRRILDVLWAVRDFKIYKTSVGISPHFSDDPKIAEAQWQRYLDLGPELAHMNYLIHLLRMPWPLSPSEPKDGSGDRRTVYDPTRVYFEREMARAIAEALLGSPERGKKTLDALSGRLEKRLRNRGRVAYFGVCVVCAVVISAAAALFLADKVGINSSEIALAAIMGTLGALLSTAAGLRNLRLDASTMSGMNLLYGGQRMMVGVLGAIVLYLALRAGFVHELLPGANGVAADKPMDPYHLAFLSILAGFSERLVPDLLDRTASGNGETENAANGADPQEADPQKGAAQERGADGQDSPAGGQTPEPGAEKGKKVDG